MMNKEVKNNEKMELAVMENGQIVDISEVENNECLVANFVSPFYSKMIGDNKFLTSVDCDSFEDRLKLVNMVTGDINMVSEHLNEDIEVKDIYIDIVEVNNEEKKIDAEPDKIRTPRIVFINKDGVGFYSTARGVVNKFENILALLGTPDKWGRTVTFNFREEKLKKNSRKIITFSIK